jgi:hypothetical protein
MKILTTLLFVFLAFTNGAFAQAMVPTEDGQGYVMEPTPSLAPRLFIDVQDVVFKKREDGTLDMHILKDEVLNELATKLVLKPRIKGENFSSAFDFPLSEDYTKYTFPETSLFSIDEDGMLLFQGKSVGDFELVIPASTSNGL